MWMYHDFFVDLPDYLDNNPNDRKLLNYAAAPVSSCEVIDFSALIFPLKPKYSWIYHVPAWKWSVQKTDWFIKLVLCYSLNYYYCGSKKRRIFFRVHLVTSGLFSFIYAFIIPMMEIGVFTKIIVTFVKIIGA